MQVPRCQSHRWRSWLLGVICLLSFPVPAADEALRGSMQALFSNLRTLLPLSVNDDRFGADENRAVVRGALHELSKGVVELERHGPQDDIAAPYLVDALSEAAADAIARYDRGELDGTRFLVRRMTQVCVACHSRLPDAIDAPLASHFAPDDELEKLTLMERGQLYVASRQFEEALDVFEQAITQAHATPGERLQAAVNHLVISIRVKGDFRRPIDVLNNVLGKQQMWLSVSDDIRSWLLALHHFQQAGMPDAGLDEARQLIDRARYAAIVPYSLQPMVEYIVASRLLHEYVASNQHDSQGLAEAYYLLGLTEYGIGYRHWLGQPENYLINAVLVAPHSAHARSAYRLLEEQIVFGYSGSSGTHIPKDVERQLSRLRALIEDAI